MANNRKENSKACPDYDHINPNHYKKGRKEVWQMMVDIWGPELFIAHCEMTAFKYRMRMGEKPDQPAERDLEKSNWYEAKAAELKNKLNSQKPTPAPEIRIDTPIPNTTN